MTTLATQDNGSLVGGHVFRKDVLSGQVSPKFRWTGVIVSPEERTYSDSSLAIQERKDSHSTVAASK